VQSKCIVLVIDADALILALQAPGARTRMRRPHSHPHPHPHPYLHPHQQRQSARVSRIAITLLLDLTRTTMWLNALHKAVRRAGRSATNLYRRRRFAVASSQPDPVRKEKGKTWNTPLRVREKWSDTTAASMSNEEPTARKVTVGPQAYVQTPRVGFNSQYEADINLVQAMNVANNVTLHCPDPVPTSSANPASVCCTVPRTRSGAMLQGAEVVSQPRSRAPLVLVVPSFFFFLSAKAYAVSTHRKTVVACVTQAVCRVESADGLCVERYSSEHHA